MLINTQVIDFLYLEHITEEFDKCWLQEKWTSHHYLTLYKMLDCDQLIWHILWLHSDLWFIFASEFSFSSKVNIKNHVTFLPVQNANMPLYIWRTRFVRQGISAATKDACLCFVTYRTLPKIKLDHNAIMLTFWWIWKLWMAINNEINSVLHILLRHIAKNRFTCPVNTVVFGILEIRNWNV